MSTGNYCETPWRDEDTLRELYVEQCMTQVEVAEELGASRHTVMNWMDRFGISAECESTLNLRDADWLHTEYVEKDKSMVEIAEHCGCSTESVSRWLSNHGIATDKSPQEKPPHFEELENGYERIRTQIDGERMSVSVHRLLMVAENGFESLVDMEIHHKNHIPWDNRAENLEIVSRTEHAKIHSEPYGSRISGDLE